MARIESREIRYTKKFIWEKVQCLVDFLNLALETQTGEAQKPQRQSRRREKAPKLKQPKLKKSDKEKLRDFLEKCDLTKELEDYKRRHGKSWLDSEHPLKLVKLWHTAKNIIDAYRENRLRWSGLWLFKREFLNRLRPSLYLEARAKSKRFGRQIATLISFGERVDGEEISLKAWRPLLWGLDPGSPLEQQDSWGIALGEIVADLAQSIYMILREQLEVRECALCQRYFIPHPQEPTGERSTKYCPKCKKRRKPKSIAQGAKPNQRSC